MTSIQSTAIETVNSDRWLFAADWIQRLARNQKIFGKYRKLCRDLRRVAIGERCGQRAAVALRRLGVVDDAIFSRDVAVQRTVDPVSGGSPPAVEKRFDQDETIAMPERNASSTSEGASVI